MEPKIGDLTFVKCNWSDFYAGAVVAIPPNTLKPLRKGSILRMFVDSNHAGDMVS